MVLEGAITIPNLQVHPHQHVEVRSLSWERTRYRHEKNQIFRRKPHCGKDLSKRKVLGLRNSRVYLKENTMREAHASLTVITSITGEEPILIDYREESNDQWDFVDFVLYACEKGYLTNGDYLILDNGSVHTGLESSRLMRDILDVTGLTLIFLPAYSPELNPCELIFNVIKNYIRNLTELTNVREAVLESLSIITTSKMISFYDKCIYPKYVLPDIIE